MCGRGRGGEWENSVSVGPLKYPMQSDENKDNFAGCVKYFNFAQ